MQQRGDPPPHVAMSSDKAEAEDDNMRAMKVPANAASAVRAECVGGALGEPEVVDQAGVVLGIHNVAIAAPQVVASLVSSLIFKSLQKPRGVAGDQSTRG